MFALTTQLKGRRRVLVLVGAVVLAAMAFVGSQLGGGGGDDPYADLAGVAARPGGSPGTTLQRGGTSPVPVQAVPGIPDEPHDHAEDDSIGPLRDPFCPLTPGASCPVQGPPPPPPSGAPMTLLDVFADGNHLHARVGIGEDVSILHVGDTVGAYRVVALSDGCGEFARGEAHRSLCRGQVWDADPAGGASPTGQGGPAPG